MYLNKGRTYCETNDANWLEPNVQSCVNLLADLHQDGFQYSGVNLARSALSAVVVIRGWGPVGGHPLVKRLLRGAFLRTSPKPRYDGIWEVNFPEGKSHSGKPMFEGFILFHSYVIIDFICGAVSDTGKADARRGKVRRR